MGASQLQSNLATLVSFDPTVVRISCCSYAVFELRRPPLHIRLNNSSEKISLHSKRSHHFSHSFVYFSEYLFAVCQRAWSTCAAALFAFMSSEGSSAVGGSARCLMTRIWLIIQKEPCVGLNRNVLLCRCLRWLAAERRHGSLSNPTWQRSPRMIGSGRKLSKCS